MTIQDFIDKLSKIEDKDGSVFVKTIDGSYYDVNSNDIFLDADNDLIVKINVYLNH